MVSERGRVVKAQAMAALTVACVLLGGAYALARPQDGGAIPPGDAPKSKTGADGLRARWDHLRAEYIRITAPLVEPLEGDGRLIAPVPDGLEMQTAKAKSAYDEAKVAREIAGIALTEYTEGTALQEIADAEAEIIVFETAVERARARLDRAKAANRQLRTALTAKRDPTAADIAAALLVDRACEDEEWALAHGKLAHEQAKTKKEMLTKFHQKKRQLELAADIEKKRSEELMRESEWELAKSKEQRVKRESGVVALNPEERRALVLLADALRSPGPLPPWQREPAEFQAFLDQFEAKLDEARRLADPTSETRQMELFMRIAARARPVAGQPKPEGH
jgi:hypothetical protein